jgi:hypothetical protein
MTKHYNRLNSRVFGMRKKLEQFRLPQDLVDALEAYSEASGISKTDIVEHALRDQMSKAVSNRLDARLRAVKKLAASQSSRAIRLSQESATKQKAESTSGNKPSQEAAG